jgi:hypothetical protein
MKRIRLKGAVTLGCRAVWVSYARNATVGRLARHKEDEYPTVHAQRPTLLAEQVRFSA